ncbi:MAG: acetyl-coenzyme A synthetase, partial [Gammaproteobacteria bacterium]|nr:acetyl-coenzyme A synthetase [Gammaproteobacteria bacterium]
MSEVHVYPINNAIAKSAHIDEAGYKKTYRQSVEHNEEFWAEAGKRLDWITPYSKIKDVSFDKKDLRIRWYYDGV